MRENCFIYIGVCVSVYAGAKQAPATKKKKEDMRQKKMTVKITYEVFSDSTPERLGAKIQSRINGLLHTQFSGENIIEYGNMCVRPTADGYVYTTWLVVQRFC